MISNLLELTGIGVLCFGIALVSLPASLIVAGLALTLLGMAVDGLQVRVRRRRPVVDEPRVL